MLATGQRLHQILMQRTYGGNIHVLSSWSGDEEVNANTALDHLACKLLETRMVCLKQLLLGFDAMQIILISEKQPAWTPCW